MIALRAVPLPLYAMIAVVSLLAVGSGRPALAADEPEQAVEKVVEDVAEEESSDGEAAGADVGEASYNTEDCEPGDGKKVSGEQVAEDAAQADDLDARCEPMPK